MAPNFCPIFREIAINVGRVAGQKGRYSLTSPLGYLFLEAVKQARKEGLQLDDLIQAVKNAVDYLDNPPQKEDREKEKFKAMLEKFKARGYQLDELIGRNADLLAPSPSPIETPEAIPPEDQLTPASLLLDDPPPQDTPEAIPPEAIPPAPPRGKNGRFKRS